MTLFELIKQETAGSRSELILAAGLSGLANAGLLVLINTAIHDTSTDRQDFRYLLILPWRLSSTPSASGARPTGDGGPRKDTHHTPSPHCGENPQADLLSLNASIRRKLIIY